MHAKQKQSRWIKTKQNKKSQYMFGHRENLACKKPTHKIVAETPNCISGKKKLIISFFNKVTE